MKNRNIILIGFMGTGKTAVGLELARRLGRKLVDTDELIEERAGMNIREIFERWGEEYFRELEHKSLDILAQHPPGSLVVATGGGIMLRLDNRKKLKKNGLIVLLTASPRAILRRTRQSGGRPLLEVRDPVERIKELLKEREPAYRHHDLMVDTTGKSVKKAAGEIIKFSKELPC